MSFIQYRYIEQVNLRFSLSKKEDIFKLDEKINVDGRYQSLNGYELFIADNILVGTIKIKEDTYSTKDIDEIYKLIDGVELEIIDDEKITSTKDKLISKITFENYVRQVNKNIGEISEIRMLSDDKTKMNLIGMIGEYSLIYHIIKIENISEEQVYWTSENKYGSDHDVMVKIGELNKIYEVKSTINSSRPHIISSREYNRLCVEPENSYLVKVIINEEIISKYSNISDKQIWNEFIRDDLKSKNIEIFIHLWESLVPEVKAYKYRVTIQ